jgi:hypothetical protein
MARVSICGFETGDASELGGSGSSFATLQGTASIQATIKRTGSYALRANPTTTATGFADLGRWTADATLSAVWIPDHLLITTCFYRFYFRADTLPASNSEELCSVYDSSSSLKLAVRINSSGQLMAFDSTGTAQTGSTGSTVLSLAALYMIELKVGTGGAAVWEVKINGTSEISGTGNLSSNGNSWLRLGKGTNRNGQSVDFYYDDVSIDDAAYPGPGEIKAANPSGDGAYTAWTGTYQAVDDLLSQAGNDGDTTVLTTSANTAAETVALEDCATLGISGAVNAVKALVVIRKVSGTQTQVRFRLRSGSTDHTTANVQDTNLLTTYKAFARVFAVDPTDSGAWTTAKVDGLQVGMVHAQSQARVLNTTLIALMVEYTPPEVASFLPYRSTQMQQLLAQ